MTIDTERRSTVSASSPIPPVAVSDREEAVKSRRWVPGEPGIWALILTDLGIFTTYFIVFMAEWIRDPEVFANGHDAIHLSAGILNTFFLLTASFFVALAVQTLRQGMVVKCQRLLLGAGLCGVAFVVNKYLEWSDKLASGHHPSDDIFFQLYFIITGIHLLHVLIAMVLLAFMSRRASRVVGAPTPQQSRFVENCASYWHMVDLLWLGILALFYLMGATA